MIAKLVTDMFMDISVNLGRALMKDRKINRYLSAALAPVLTTLVEGIIKGVSPKDMAEGLKGRSGKKRRAGTQEQPGDELKTAGKEAKNEDWEDFFRLAALNLEDGHATA